VELVYVDAFVTKKGSPVTGLASADFRLEDNGVRQQVEVLDRTVVPTTAILVLDNSASVEGRHLVHLKEAARTLLSGLGERDEAALVTFNEKVHLRQDATRDIRSVTASLDRVRSRGGTALIDALYLALKRRWGTGRPIIVLFTDGQDSTSWLENEDVFQAARESSALLHVVGTEPAGAPSSPPDPTSRLPRLRTDRPRSRDLEPLASRRSVIVRAGVRSEPADGESGHVYLLRRTAETTGGAYWAVDSTADLPATFRRILEASAARYVLRYEPIGVTRAGRHRLEVSVRRGGVDVRARQEYVVRGALAE
jgi:Ca-activated chloride channel family protein